MKIQHSQGAQWLSGRVCVWRLSGRWFGASPASLGPYLVLVQPRKIRPCLTERLLMGCKESNQTKQNTVQSLYNARFWVHYEEWITGDKNISILHLSYRTSDIQFSLVLQTHALVL